MSNLTLEQLEEQLSQKCREVKEETVHAESALQRYLQGRSQRQNADALLAVLRELYVCNRRIRDSQEDIANLMGLCIEAQHSRQDRMITQMQKVIEEAQEAKRAYLPRLNREFMQTQKVANIVAAQIMRLRTNGGVTNLGYDHYSTKEEKQEATYKAPTNVLFKDHHDQMLDELRTQFKEERKSMKKMYVPGILHRHVDPTPDQNREIPWINVLLQPWKFKGPAIEDWDISDLVAICHYYGAEDTPLPPTLEKYVFLMDPKAWNPFQITRPEVMLGDAATNAERAAASFKQPVDPKPTAEPQLNNHTPSVEDSSTAGKRKK